VKAIFHQTQWMRTTPQREEKELVLADPIFQLALNCEYEVVKSEHMRSVGEVMAHWYSPFWDLGTTEGPGFQTQWCASETLACPLCQ